MLIDATVGSDCFPHVGARLGENVSVWMVCLMHGEQELIGFHTPMIPYWEA